MSYISYIKTNTSKLIMYKTQLQKLHALPKIQQKSEEWYEIRRNMITASDFAQALGHGKFGTQRQLIEKKCLPRENETIMSRSNPFFKWGIMFEPVATDIYSDMYKTHVHEFGLIQHPKYDFFGASPDGITDDGIMLEIKCPFKRKLTGDIPLQYYYQIQGQLDVCELDECDYFECTFEMSEGDIKDFIENGKGKYKGVLSENVDGSYNYEELYPPDCHPTITEKDPKKKYWILKEYNLKRVEKDVDFVNKKLQELKGVWDKIVFYRNNPKAFELEIVRSVDISTERYNSNRSPLSKTKVTQLLSTSEYMFLD